MSVLDMQDGSYASPANVEMDKQQEVSDCSVFSETSLHHNIPELLDWTLFRADGAQDSDRATGGGVCSPFVTSKTLLYNG